MFERSTYVPAEQKLLEGGVASGGRSEPLGEGIAHSVERSHLAVDRADHDIVVVIDRVAVGTFWELHIARSEKQTSTGADHRVAVQAIGDTDPGSEQSVVLRAHTAFRMVRAVD